MEYLGKKFYIGRGVRQGDPYSPLIFVLATDLLQSILNKAMRLNLITPPLQVNSWPDFPIVQYADGTLVIMKANARHLICLKAILNTFASATGLKVNDGKSILVPLNIDEERVVFLQTHFRVPEAISLLLIWGYHWEFINNCGAMFTSCQQDC